MAQSDSQRTEFEELDSSNLDSAVSVDGDGEALESAVFEGSESVDPRTDSSETFGGGVEDMLGSIEIDANPVVDESGEGNAHLEAAEPNAVDELAFDGSIAADVRDEVADAFAEEESDDQEDSCEMASTLPNPEDLLAQAGSILNGGDFRLPTEEAEETETETPAERDEDELMTMPDPQSLMEQTGEESQQDDELIEMPDPQSLMVWASEEVSESEPEKAVKSQSEEAAEFEPNEAEEDIELMAMPDPQAFMNAASDNPGEVPDLPQMNAGSNIADKAGDLSPPPPAPVCLDDGEIYVEDEVSEPEEAKEVFEAVEKNIASEDEAKAIKSPEIADSEDSAESSSEELDDVSFLMEDDELLAQGSSLDGFNVGSEAADAEETLNGGSPLIKGAENRSYSASKHGIARRTLQSTALAAGLLLVGLGITLSFVKEELYGFFKGSSLEESTLSWHVATIAKQVFEELEDTRNYHVDGFQTEIQQASDTEVLIEVKMEAHLNTDLYLPVEDALVYSKIDFAPGDLDAAAQFVSSEYPEKSLAPPEKPWKELYRLSARKGENFPLNASFWLTRESAEEAWSFSKLNVKAGSSNLIWGQGEVVDFHEDTSMVIDSKESQYRLRTYKLAAESYLEKVNALQSQFVAEENKRERERVERRNHLATSLSKGSYFKGMAIAGEDGAYVREISLIITETRNEGGLIKGVLKLDSNQKHSKHFTGILDILEKENGSPQALLSLTTVAFENQPVVEAPAFFKPGTVSRLALKTDGYRMEGDGAEISLRLIRSR